MIVPRSSKWVTKTFTQIPNRHDSFVSNSVILCAWHALNTLLCISATYNIQSIQCIWNKSLWFRTLVIFTHIHTQIDRCVQKQSTSTAKFSSSANVSLINTPWHFFWCLTSFLLGYLVPPFLFVMILILTIFLLENLRRMENLVCSQWRCSRKLLMSLNCTVEKTSKTPINAHH